MGPELFPSCAIYDDCPALPKNALSLHSPIDTGFAGN